MDFEPDEESFTHDAEYRNTSPPPFSEAVRRRLLSDHTPSLRSAGSGVIDSSPSFALRHHIARGAGRSSPAGYRPTTTTHNPIGRYALFHPSGTDARRRGVPHRLWVHGYCSTSRLIGLQPLLAHAVVETKSREHWSVHNLTGNRILRSASAATKSHRASQHRQP